MTFAEPSWEVSNPKLTVDGRNPANQLIVDFHFLNWLSYISDGAGFRSTVAPATLVLEDERCKLAVRVVLKRGFEVTDFANQMTHTGSIILTGSSYTYYIFK